ncbi:geranylgeranyl diphosphate synthase, type II [Oribacterium sp. WCC10]|nr:geranylgeranyl diphosphate synthase, type II [Oribacterium sp. WCC10]
MEFSHELNETVTTVNEIIKNQLPPVDGLQSTVLEAMKYSVEAGGKRIRPMLMLKSYELYIDIAGESRDRFMRPILHACMGAMEMIHTFSLCHDDLPCMDGDKYRRGRESTWYKFGEAMGTLAGDALSLYAFEAVSEAYRKQLTSALSGESDISATDINSFSLSVVKAINYLSSLSGVNGMLGGQVVDVEMTGHKLSNEQLMFIYRLKTGALLQASLMTGAILGGADDEDIARLSGIGEKIGVAFQIQDDILDETSTEEVLGKPIHSDDLNNKTTYVSIYGLSEAHKEVEKLSVQAIEELKELKSVNEDCKNFLISLTDMLINRKK